MKIALKYGLLITLGVMAWVVIAHLLVPNPQSKLHSVGAFVFFNVLQFAAIYLGIKAKGREIADRPTFKEGMKTGVSISFVFAVSSAFFFVTEIIILGPALLAAEPGAQTQPIWRVALGAFAGLFFGSLLFGLVYSTVISFGLAKRGVK